MIRRIVAFVVFIALIAGVSTLVYFNAQETSFRLAPNRELTLPLGMLMLGAVVAGALVMFLFALMREGRHALREWRVHRELRAAERTAEQRTRARALALAGDFKQARALLSKATRRHAPQASDIVDYAETYLMEGNAAEARRLLEEGQKDVGNDPVLLFALARACRATDDPAAAISALERALGTYPNSLPALTLLRDLLVEREMWERAAPVQERIVALRPHDTSEENRLAGIRLEAARNAPPEARAAALRTVLSAHPGFIPAAIAYARALHTQGDTRRALKTLERLARQDPHPAILDEIERIAGADERGRVCKLYAKLLSGRPTDVELRIRAARYFVDAEKPDEAEQILRALPADHDSPRTAAVRARIFEARGDTQAAHEELRRALGCCDQAPHAFLCEACASSTGGWKERCDCCGAWGTLQPHAS